VAQLMQTKLGPNQIKMSIEHDYLHKNYHRALQSALAYIAAVEDDSIDCKITNPKEIIETAALSAWKIGDMKTAVECVDKLVCVDYTVFSLSTTTNATSELKRIRFLANQRHHLHAWRTLCRCDIMLC
jgi:hypothetical protein